MVVAVMLPCLIWSNPLRKSSPVVVEKDAVSGKRLMLVKIQSCYDSPVMPGLMSAGSVTACSSFRHAGVLQTSGDEAEGGTTA